MGCNKQIYINDTTLRDGAQQPGVYFSAEDRGRIMQMLIDAGVDDIEVSTVHAYSAAPDMIPEHLRLQHKDRFSLWCRATEEDALLAMRTGLKRLHFSVPVSEIQLRTMNLSKRWVLSQLETVVKMVRRSTPYVSIGAMDATRCNPAFLTKLARLLSKLGVERLRLSDTVGIALPTDVAAMVQTVRSHFDGDIEFHGHNDIGMAVANSVTATQHGANAIGVTVNGIGERSGNADMATVAAALRFASFKNDCNVDVSAMKNLSDQVAVSSGVDVSRNAPVVGADIFTHESGIHVNGILKDPLTFQPFSARDVNRGESKFVLGAQSGSRAVQHQLAVNDIHISRRLARMLLPLVQREAERNQGTVSDDQLLQIWNSKKA